MQRTRAIHRRLPVCIQSVVT